ncbi:MAG: FeoB-associated Cys-rich membrane protein [Ruminococcus sp.]|nr:FeoB-associated Cys-rich membrane protein [Ruminococcus sp.]
MLEWISQNLATIIISVIVIAVVATIIIKMMRDKKNGKTSCGCGCDNCPSSSMCHKSK